VEVMGNKGHVEEYPCSCFGSNSTCWIVRHPLADPPPSFPSKKEAEAHLKAYREKENE